MRVKYIGIESCRIRIGDTDKFRGCGLGLGCGMSHKIVRLVGQLVGQKTVGQKSLTDIWGG
ncbi:6858_t:CDS:2 [Funneliformis mosseae]|uniref:6858_t:CDS:1 n=1 Tax=Funneliformis mosseae TaxID=27381 RepID=A0A9N9EEC9_FUNMO|nr:6858_t:CDS:2 [Funneliformis mosseae]